MTERCDCCATYGIETLATRRTAQFRKEWAGSLLPYARQIRFCDGCASSLNEDQLKEFGLDWGDALAPKPCGGCGHEYGPSCLRPPRCMYLDVDDAAVMTDVMTDDEVARYSGGPEPEEG